MSSKKKPSRKTPDSQHFDVIVIGAGMAGLTCAARLQKAGKKVLLLEQHTKPGGYCTNFKRKGYEFDAAIHFIAGCEPGGMLHDILVECGAENYVDFIKLDPVVYKAVFPDRTLLIPPTLNEFAALIGREFPAEAQNIKNYFQGMERIYDLLAQSHDKKVPQWKKSLAPFLHPKDFSFFLKHMNATLGEYMDQHLTDRRVREIAAQLWAFLGVPPDKLSLVFFIMAFMAYFKQGAYYISGGSQALSDAFARAFTENGGILLTRADAQRILVSGNQARGVEVKNKKTGKVTRYAAGNVVSAADATHTYLDLVGQQHLPLGFCDGIRKMTPSMSAVCVYLGVDMDLPEKYREDFDVFASFTYDSEAGFEKVKNREGFDAIALAFYSNVYPGFSPAPGKKHVITLVVLLDLEEPRMKELWGISHVDRRGKNYQKIKKKLAAELMELAEGLLPGLSEHVEVMEIATPVTMKRYTKNANGALVGWENNIGQSLLNRMGQRSPIKNLSLASAWTFPGGGVNGATMGGDMAAERILRQGLLSRLPLPGGVRKVLDMGNIAP